MTLPAAVTALAEALDGLGWVSDLLVGGSLATGDYVIGVSDLDLVAIAKGPVDATRCRDLTAVHQALDARVAAGADLGCAYVDAYRLESFAATHPTWTHGVLVPRVLSGIARAELVLEGFAVLGREPAALLPPVSHDDVRAAARSELCGYWRTAARRPWWWSDPVIADLGLTSMARGRYALRTGRLLTTTAAIEQADAPAWLRDQLRARRQGEAVVSPRLQAGWIAWRDARRTVAGAAAISPGRGAR